MVSPPDVRDTAGESTDAESDATERVSYDARVHTPTVLVVDGSVRTELFEHWLGDDFAVRTATSRHAAFDGLDAAVAVAVVRNELSTDLKEKLQQLIAARAPYCRTIITTTERVEIMYPGMEYDVCLSEPTERESFRETVGRLMLRARYDANLRNYYECSMSAANREVRLPDDALQSDETYQRLTERMSAIKERLDVILSRFTTDDLDAVQKSIRPDVEFGQGTKATNKQQGEKYRPEKCVGCELDWTVDHGGSIGEGYKRLGAFVWECAECGTVQNLPDPSHRRVAWR